MDKYRIDDSKMVDLKEIYESMEFGEASDTMVQPPVVTKPIAPPKDAPRDIQAAYVAELKKWLDYNASLPSGPKKVAVPADKMSKKPSASKAMDSEEGSGLKLNLDALLQDGAGNYWVTKYDQVMFLYRTATDTEAGEPILHPDERQFRHSDKIYVYRRFIKSNGELTQKGADFIENKDPQDLEIIVDNYLDKITADKGEGLPDNTLARSNAVLDLDEPLKEEAKQGEVDRRLA